ncbi:AFG1-like ATPase, partial [Helicosporidium sp. ATCC 50920]
MGVDRLVFEVCAPATRCIPLADDASTCGFRLSVRWSSAEAARNHGQKTGGLSSTEASDGSSSAEGASSSSTPQDGPLALYEALVTSQQLRADPRQSATAARLQKLYDSLVGGEDLAGRGGGSAAASAPSRPSGLTLTRAASTPPPRTWLSSLLGSFTPSETPAPPPPPKGLYMFGGVGVGKTMVMDLFVQALQTHEPAQRVHFHDFMLSVHQSLRVHSRVPDPLREVARDVLASGRVLCLDELFVTDVADASILNRLFALLWEGGLVLVATSNRAPDALYEGGLQRDLFLPFIHALHARCAVHDMESEVDHRRLARARGGRYVLDPGGADEIEARFAEAAGSSVAAAESLPVAMGRELLLHRAVPGAALARFPELCA